MNTRKCAGTALVVLAFAAPSMPAAFSAPTKNIANGPFAVRVNVQTALNVRSGASTNNSIVGTAKGGQIFAVVSKSGEFYKVWYGAGTGWMHGSYLEDASNETVTVTASVLNVRTGASTSNSDIGDAPQGSVFAVTATSGDWKKITWRDGSGWVNAQYVRASKAGDGNSGGSTGGGSTGGGSTGGSSHGTTTSSAGFISLNASGPGFYGYTADTGRWGIPKFIYGIERVARRWSTERPSNCPARMGVGDISKKNGGPFSGHASHQKGVDADFSLPRNDGVELPRVDRFSSKYSRAGTQKEINLFRAELPVTMIFFNDPNVTGRQNWPNHDNHFHVRISK